MSVHRWTHYICARCWIDQGRGGERVEERAFEVFGARMGDPEEPCCWCGRPGFAPVRHDPNDAALKCMKEPA